MHHKQKLTMERNQEVMFALSEFVMKNRLKPGGEITMTSLQRNSPKGDIIL